MRIGINLALSLISITVTLYAVEAVLTFLRPGEAKGNCPRIQIETDKCLAAQSLGRPFDSRSRVEVLQDLESRGDTAWPNFNSWELNLRGETIRLNGTPVQPLGGISRVKTLYCNERGTYELYESDEYGFRNPPNQHQGPARLVLIGDSFVQGYCIPTDSTVAALLRTDYQPAVNLGRDNHGPLSQLAVLREYAAPLRPEVVLWFYFEGNDLSDLETEKTREPLTRYLDPAYSAHLTEHADSLDDQLRRIVESKRPIAEERGKRRRSQAPDQATSPGSFFTLARLRQLAGRALHHPPAPPVPFDQPLYQRVLTQAKREAESWGGRFILIYLPAWQRFGQPDAANPHRDRVLQVAKDLAIPVVDITQTFRGTPDPLELFPFRLPGHYEPAAHRLIAREIRTTLQAVAGAVGSSRE